MPANKSKAAKAAGGPSVPGICTPKALPPYLVMHAAQAALAINPLNAPSMEPWAPKVAPDHLAMLTTAYWGIQGVAATVGLMERASAAFVDRLLSHMNAWGARANVAFTYTDTDPSPIVRITRRGSGYWSYLGTGILSIPRDQPTMCLQDFDMNTPDPEYYRVIRHETGHTLSFPHEHMRAELVSLLDEAKTIAYFGQTQGWDARTVREQILTPLDPRTIKGSAADATSIMAYQLPSACTKSGEPILGGTDINERDHAFAASIYPKASGLKPLTPEEIADKLAGIF